MGQCAEGQDSPPAPASVSPAAGHEVDPRGAQPTFHCSKLAFGSKHARPVSDRNERRGTELLLPRHGFLGQSRGPDSRPSPTSASCRWGHPGLRFGTRWLRLGGKTRVSDACPRPTALPSQASPTVRHPHRHTTAHGTGLPVLDTRAHAPTPTATCRLQRKPTRTINLDIFHSLFFEDLGAGGVVVKYIRENFPRSEERAEGQRRLPRLGRKGTTTKAGELPPQAGRAAGPRPHADHTHICASSLLSDKEPRARRPAQTPRSLPRDSGGEGPCEQPTRVPWAILGPLCTRGLGEREKNRGEEADGSDGIKRKTMLSSGCPGGQLWLPLGKQNSVSQFPTKYPVTHMSIKARATVGRAVSSQDVSKSEPRYL